MRRFGETITLVFISLFFNFGAQAQTPIFGEYGAPAWSRTFKYLESRFGNVAKDEVVLILPTATNAAWDDPNGVLRAMEMYKWGDWMPSNAWQYSPNSGKRVSEGYRYFLNAAFVSTVDANGTASPALKNALKRANEEVEYTRAQYNQIQSLADDAYTKYVAAEGKKKTKDQFFRDQGYDVEIDTRKKRLNSALQTFVAVTSSIIDPDIDMLTRAKIKFDNPKQQISLPPIRDLLNDKDRWQQYYVSFIDKNILTFLKEANIQNQSIQESSYTSDFFEQKWKASVSVSFLGIFRAGGASAEQIKREQHIKSNATKIDISFTNIDTFNIVRGEWFDQGVIDRFGPKLNSEMYTTMWGPNGQLELIPKTLLIGRGMTFTVYADSQSLDYLYDHFQGGADAGFFIGYWKVGGGGEYSSTKEQTKISRFADRIEFADLSNRAKVLGVLSKYYAASIPKPSAAPFFSASAKQNSDATKRIDSLWKQPAAREKLKDTLDAKTIKQIFE